MAKEIASYTTPQEFYFGVPLYERLRLNVGQIKDHLMQQVRVDGYCPYCRRMSTFHGAGGSRRSGYNDAYFVALYEISLHELKCARKDEHVLRFYWLLSNASLQKIGQYPSFADIALDESKNYSSILDINDSAEFHKAIGLASHGVGIGSYVYLRRIFERLIAKRFAEYKDEEGWDENAFKQLRMSERIEFLTSHLPEFLVKNAKIYSILSLGVHELDEKDCLAFFPVLRQSTIWILEEDRKHQEELAQQKALHNAIAGFKPSANPEAAKS